MKVAQSCPTLCDPMDYTVHGILQARILEWVAFPFFRGSSQPRDPSQVSHIAGGFFTSWATREALIQVFSSVQLSPSVVSDSLRPHELPHARPPCPSPTLEVYSNSCPSSQWCHPAISSSVVPFSRRSSQPRDPSQVSSIAGRFFTSWAQLQADSLPAEPQGKAKNNGVGSLSLL